MPNASYFNDELDKIVFGGNATLGEQWTVPNRTPGVALPKAAASGTLLLAYFTARQAADVLTATVWVTTAQGATPTLGKMALFTEASTGDITNVAVTANDATMFDSTGAVSKAFTATYTLIPGQRYAFGVLAIGAGVGPTLVAAGGTGTDSEGLVLAATPRLAGVVTGQTDIPSSVATGSIAAMTTANATKPGIIIARLV